MAETLSIKERITAAVATALAEISIAAGYQVDVEEVVRPRRTGEGFLPKHYGVAVIQDDADRDQEYDLASNPPVIAWKLPIACDCVVRVSEHDETPMDKVLNQFEADVQKCLMADGTWGGLALFSALGASQYPPAGDGAEGVIVWLHVTYRVSETDPYEQR